MITVDLKRRGFGGMFVTDTISPDAHPGTYVPIEELNRYILSMTRLVEEAQSYINIGFDMYGNESADLQKEIDHARTLIRDRP